MKWSAATSKSARVVVLDAISVNRFLTSDKLFLVIVGVVLSMLMLRDLLETFLYSLVTCSQDSVQWSSSFTSLYNTLRNPIHCIMLLSVSSYNSHLLVWSVKEVASPSVKVLRKWLTMNFWVVEEVVRFLTSKLQASCQQTTYTMKSTKVQTLGTLWNPYTSVAPPQLMVLTMH